MGNFYVNFSVKSTDQAVIVTALQQAKRNAYVSPVINGIVVVFDQETDYQELGSILWLGNLLSGAAATPVLAVLNHDDDVLAYWLFEHGALTSEYNSDPGYFAGEEIASPAADVARLCQVFGVPAAIEAVQGILYDAEYVFVLDQHAALVAALGLPECTVGFGFNYIDEDDVDLSAELSKADLLRVS